MSETQGELLTSVQRLTRDLSLASVTLSANEVRFLVDAYYQMQLERIRHEGQIRAMGDKEPHMVLSWLMQQSNTLENQIKRALDKYTRAHRDGAWLHSIVGIGPVISAGLLAHIDINKAPTVGHIWRFAGLDPTLVWNKGQKRPFNARLKTICWKAGESFVKNCNREGCYYGQLYKQRKEYELRRNGEGLLADQAKQMLVRKNFRTDTDAYRFYNAGFLPPAHIHARARRWAVKLFLAHLHHIMFVSEFGKEPPAPYPIAFLGHVDYLPPPSPGTEAPRVYPELDDVDDYDPEE